MAIDAARVPEGASSAGSRVVAPQHVDVGPLVRALREHVRADRDRIADRGRQRQLEAPPAGVRAARRASRRRAGSGSGSSIRLAKPCLAVGADARGGEVTPRRPGGGNGRPRRAARPAGPPGETISTRLPALRRRRAPAEHPEGAVVGARTGRPRSAAAGPPAPRRARAAAPAGASRSSEQAVGQHRAAGAAQVVEHGRCTRSKQLRPLGASTGAARARPAAGAARSTAAGRPRPACARATATRLRPIAAAARTSPAAGRRPGTHSSSVSSSEALIERRSPMPRKRRSAAIIRGRLGSARSGLRPGGGASDRDLS